MNLNLDNDPQIIDTTTADGTFVHVHVLRPVVGVNLNAGEDGAPKQMLIGNTNRLRVSAQAQKRAMRTWTHHFLAEVDTAARTRHTPALVADELVARGRDKDEAINTVAGVLASVGDGFTISAGTVGRTDEIVFLPRTAVPALADLIDAEWDTMDDTRATVSGLRDTVAPPEPGAKKARAKKDEKVTIPKQSLPAAFKSKVEAAFAGGTNLELALYGRMLTALPGSGAVDAAGSVAHSYSVDPVALLSDTWSVKDDWQDGGVFGAAHYATGKDARVLASGTMYQWSALDRTQLRANLAPAFGDDQAGLDQACKDAERLFVSAAVWAIPSAAAHSTGSQTPPTFAVAAVTDRAPVTANCFTTAVTADDVPSEAATRLGQYLTSTNRFFPSNGGTAVWLPQTGAPAPALPDTITVL